MDENLLTSCSLEEFPDDIVNYEADKLFELKTEGLMPNGHSSWNTLRIETLRGLICLHNREIAMLHHHLYHPNGGYLIQGNLYDSLKRKEKRLLHSLRIAQRILQQRER
jgi:hypothetical protein